MMQASVYNFTLTLTPLDVFFRLLCAMVVGLVIGTEREYSNRPAGMRTHILVSLGACAVMMTGQVIYAQYSANGASPDPARLGAQVITGVGFLGAGTILREGPNVKGLTTAASLWTVACLGLAAGGGYYWIALMGMVFIFITLTAMEAFQHRLIGAEVGLRHGWLEVNDVSSGLDALNKHIKKQDAALHSLTVEQSAEGIHRIYFIVDIGGIHSKRRRHHFVRGISADPAFLKVHLYHEESMCEEERC